MQHESKQNPARENSAGGAGSFTSMRRTLIRSSRGEKSAAPARGGGRGVARRGSRRERERETLRGEERRGKDFFREIGRAHV